jgi:hypothetical protein
MRSPRLEEAREYQTLPSRRRIRWYPSAMISPEEFVERLCLLGADRGPRSFPRKRRDRQILMKSFLLGLDSSRSYDEGEINDAIQSWNRDVAPAIQTDHVTVRRHLVDHGLLERTADGRAYRVGFPPGPVAFDLEVDEIDVRATVAAYLDQVRRRPKRAPQRTG